ncbi:hypothetical protein L2E82_02871 [Cichorium intybus]|uniref:Uncharacterized protein n=1 Tax=Cichorium intybus TaxID=13427 RepID=A0ACB9H2J0_CICIN|nr:hypothetical protein L2E82_02871 [Cichorium intybus]
MTSTPFSQVSALFQPLLVKAQKNGTLIHNYHLSPSNFFLTTKNRCPTDFRLKQVLRVKQVSYCNRSEKIETKMATAITAAGDANSTSPEQNPGIRLQKIVLRNNHGEKLVGLLHETGSKEIVILCHGFQSTKESNTMVNLASALEKEGITAFRFDFAGNGESEGTFQYGNYRREADDLHSVIQHFTKSNRVTRAILGHSKGGNVVLLYASKYHDIHRVINVSGRYNTEGGVEERLGKGYLQKVKKDGFIDVKAKTGEVLYRVTEESLMDRLNTNMHEACLRIDKDSRVLTVHGSDDSIVGVEEALEFAKIIPNHKLHVIDGANHGFSKHQDELISVVLSFIKDE